MNRQILILIFIIILIICSIITTNNLKHLEKFVGGSVNPALVRTNAKNRYKELQLHYNNSDVLNNFNINNLTVKILFYDISKSPTSDTTYVVKSMILPPTQHVVYVPNSTWRALIPPYMDTDSTFVYFLIHPDIVFSWNKSSGPDPTQTYGKAYWMPDNSVQDFYNSNTISGRFTGDLNNGTKSGFAMMRKVFYKSLLPNESAIYYTGDVGTGEGPYPGTVTTEQIVERYNLIQSFTQLIPLPNDSKRMRTTIQGLNSRGQNISTQNKTTGYQVGRSFSSYKDYKARGTPWMVGVHHQHRGHLRHLNVPAGVRVWFYAEDNYEGTSIILSNDTHKSARLSSGFNCKSFKSQWIEMDQRALAVTALETYAKSIEDISKTKTVDGWVYKGCFNDSHYDRDLPLLSTNENKTMDQLECSKRARDGGFTYFGLQNGGTCRVGNAYGKHAIGDLVEKEEFGIKTLKDGGSPENCTLPCGGDINNHRYGAIDSLLLKTGQPGCGSQNWNSIYQITDITEGRAPCGDACREAKKHIYDKTMTLSLTRSIQKKDWECYIERYPDLKHNFDNNIWPSNEQEATDHWNRYGNTEKEGRTWGC